MAYEWLVASSIVAAIMGSIGHELAHWIVWKMTGRRPRLDLRGNGVYPRAGPSHTTVGDRVAAVAPYVVGAGAVLSGGMLGEVVLVAFGVGMLVFVSKEDVAVMLGRAEWELG